MIIAAGGTGGHIFPAIALAKRFESDGHQVVIISTGNDLEKKIFAQIQEIHFIVYSSKVRFNKICQRF